MNRLLNASQYGELSFDSVWKVYFLSAYKKPLCSFLKKAIKDEISKISHVVFKNCEFSIDGINC